MTQFPRIHNNGTSGQDLLDPLTDAVEALCEARFKLQACAPHGRDYYPIPGDAATVATYEHVERLRRINLTISELQKIMGSVLDQMDEHEKARGR